VCHSILLPARRKSREPFIQDENIYEQRLGKSASFASSFDSISVMSSLIAYNPNAVRPLNQPLIDDPLLGKFV
jgi:hypothetical protein